VVNLTFGISDNLTFTGMIENLKVIELSTVLAGPSVGMFFAELGAEVIKLEHPSLPDVTRSWKLPSEDRNAEVSAYFSAVNYRKSYRDLELSKGEVSGELSDLLSGADILLVNFKKGDDQKFGLIPEAIHAINPALIIGKITGFGDDSDRVAYDLILQAESGFMSMNGTPDSGPVKMPVALIDVLAAHQLKEGILVALLQRTKTGKGATVAVSLYDAAVSSLVNQASNYLMEGHVPQRIGSLHPNIAPYGELFRTSDGKMITFAIGSDAHFRKLCEFLEMPQLAEDPLFVSNADRVSNRVSLAALLAEKIAGLTGAEIATAMLAAHVPMGTVRALDEVFSDEKAQKLVRTETIAGRETKRVTSIAFDIHGNKNA
jgi:crotonobetainyl-CoA:carnitine CoA-transferase CaiB-like acyl-CoA transferase